MHRLELHFLQIVEKQYPLQHRQKILLGVSGGADSTAMLHLFAAIQARLQVDLHVMYVDHGLRPQEVSAEKKQVGQQAAQVGIPVSFVSVDTRAHAQEKKLSLEHAARNLRYRAFSKKAEEIEASTLAVAHTADDQAEEILLRLLRGGGRKALSGMCQQSTIHTSLQLIRPLLNVKRQDLIRYLQDCTLSYSHDSSNDDLRFLRNRVRHELLPLLEKNYDAGVRHALRKSAENLSQDEDLLESLQQQAWQKTVQMKTHKDDHTPRAIVEREPFTRLHAALQRRIIERLLWTLDSKAIHEHILLIITAAQTGRTGSELHLHKGLRVLVQKSMLEFSYPQGKRAWRGRAQAK